MARKSSHGTEKAKGKAPPHAWKPGQSGNPGGRAKTPAELIEAFRARTPQALATLDKVMRDFADGHDNVRAGDAVKAADVVLCRGWGNAPVKVELAGDAAAPVRVEVKAEAPDAERIARIVQTLERAGALAVVGATGDAGGGDDAEAAGCVHALEADGDADSIPPAE